MGNVISDIKRSIGLNTFNPIHLSVSYRQIIIKYWLIQSKIDYLATDIMNIIMLYSHYIFQFIPENVYYKVFHSSFRASKVESTHPMEHEHDAYPERAGILFGDIFDTDMRYYCTVQCINPFPNPPNPMGKEQFEETSNYLTMIQIALVDIDFKVGCALNGAFDCVIYPPWRNVEQFNFTHVLKIIVDMKLKKFILHNQTTNKELCHTDILKSQCRLCFVAIQRYTTLEIIDQSWFN
eukprot:453606_1